MKLLEGKSNQRSFRWLQKSCETLEEYCGCKRLWGLDQNLAGNANGGG